ncbi:unnamed protein product [Soboliphyme baturini]|uniref:OAR domain-containing protein n=1 Tax=Soboliphyme baturini TaxID=241478 RepID=A0A183IAV8_9BILA|nr:unnamed protein product [Soboliphyme baturini]
MYHRHNWPPPGRNDDGNYWQQVRLQAHGDPAVAAVAFLGLQSPQFPASVHHSSNNDCRRGGYGCEMFGEKVVGGGYGPEMAANISGPGPAAAAAANSSQPHPSHPAAALYSQAAAVAAASHVKNFIPRFDLLAAGAHDAMFGSCAYSTTATNHHTPATAPDAGPHSLMCHFPGAISGNTQYDSRVVTGSLYPWMRCSGVQMSFGLCLREGANNKLSFLLTFRISGEVGDFAREMK